MRGVPVIAANPRDGSRLLRFLAEAQTRDMQVSVAVEIVIIDEQKACRGTCAMPVGRGTIADRNRLRTDFA
jgi:hypothetical protein